MYSRFIVRAARLAARTHFAYIGSQHGPVSVTPRCTYTYRPQGRFASRRLLAGLVGKDRWIGGPAQWRMRNTAGHSVQYAGSPRAESDRTNGQSALGAAFTLVKCNWGIGMSECLPAMPASLGLTDLGNSDDSQ